MALAPARQRAFPLVIGLAAGLLAHLRVGADAAADDALRDGGGAGDDASDEALVFGDFVAGEVEGGGGERGRLRLR